MPLEKKIREPEFAKRLAQAADRNDHVPEMQKGRYSWFRDQFERRYDIKISTQSVLNWFSGVAKPDKNNASRLAALLNVDEAWLMMGVEADVRPTERKARVRAIDGAANALAGFIQIAGGQVAFPTEKDEGSSVDLFAIIKGARYNFHVSLAQPTPSGNRFAVAQDYKDLFVVGAVPVEGPGIIWVEIPHDLIEANATPSGSLVVVHMSEEQVAKYRIHTFAERL